MMAEGRSVICPIAFHGSLYVVKGCGFIFDEETVPF
jgi:hypothetical protein